MRVEIKAFSVTVTLGENDRLVVHQPDDYPDDVAGLRVDYGDKEAPGPQGSVKTQAITVQAEKI